MNLQALRDKLYSLSDYKPGNPAYQKEIDGILTDAASQIWNEHQWAFSMKRAQIHVPVDIGPAFLNAECYTSGSDSPNVVASCITGELGVNIKNIGTGDQPYFTIGEAPSIPKNDGITNHWIGQPIEILGEEYTIKNIAKATGNKATGIMIYLDRAVQTLNPGRTVTQGDTNWEDDWYQFQTTDFKIKTRYTWLPHDLQELHSANFRPWPHASDTTHKLPIKSWYETTQYVGDLDLTGTPTTAFIEPDLVIPAGQKISASWTSGSSGSRNFPGDRYYEVAYANMGPGGQFGPLSETVITTPGTTATDTYMLNIYSLGADGLDDTDHAAAPGNTGTGTSYDALQIIDNITPYPRVGFINSNFNHTTGKRLGEPKWVPITKGANSSPSANDAVTSYQAAKTNVPEIFLNGYLRAIDYRFVGSRAGIAPVRFDNRVKALRLYPRNDLADTDRPALNPHSATELYGRLPAVKGASLELVYKYNPLLPASGQDAVEIPTEFGYLVVYKALVDLYLKNGNPGLSSLYERRYEKELKALIRRYNTSGDGIRIKGGPASIYQIRPDIRKV